MSGQSRSGGSSPSHRSTTAPGSLRGKPATRQRPGPARKTGPSQTPKRPSRARTDAAKSSRTTKSKQGASRKGGARKQTPAPFIPGPARSGRRLAPAYDLEGPRVRLGIAWFIVVFAALGIGRAFGDFPLVGVVYAAVGAIAAAQIVDAWAGPRASVQRAGAVVIAAVVGLSASLGAATLGAALLAGTVVGIGVAAVGVFQRRPALPALALVLQAALPTGLVAASVVLTMRYEIGACVILLALVMAFDVGDFLIGSGAGSLAEGPVAGALMIVLVAAVAAIIEAPPFNGTLVWAFAALAAVLCPLGQVAASWLLPDASTRASALRRLDSLLLLGPVWAFGTGLVVAHG